MEKPKRPDLSFLTKNKFKSMEEIEDFFESCDDEKQKIIDNAVVMIPELIQIAEMFFDGHPNPESIPFKICCETLNKIKNVY